VQALKGLSFETIMINCNPETVSTDFDVADRLYFEPITLEHVLNVVEKEQPWGVIVQLGGQTPLSLAKALQDAGVNILGTSPNDIDMAEDRLLARELFADLGLNQPPSIAVNSLNEALELGPRLGFPLMVRPSYVLGGQAMVRVYRSQDFAEAVSRALTAGGEKPVLIDRFLDGAIEIDVDAIADGDSIYVAGILQHIEEAGIHSGDSFGVLPPYDLSNAIIELIIDATKKIARALNVIGMLNIQFAVKNNALYILEANPRASRTVPFLSKASGIPLASVAAVVLGGAKLPSALRDKNYMAFMPKGIIAIKAPVMPFAKFPNADPLLGPEMRSTGEVMTTANCFEEAFLKGQIAAGSELASSGNILVSVADPDKEALLLPLRQMHQSGFKIFATMGTHYFLKANDLPSTLVNKVREGSPHVLDLLESGSIDLMFNTILGESSVYDSHLFRKKALKQRIPYFTSVSAARAVAKALSLKQDLHAISVISLQEMHESLEFNGL
jgi:carbamoyl-phosphate synthase large subunit